MMRASYRWTPRTTRHCRRRCTAKSPCASYEREIEILDERGTGPAPPRRRARARARSASPDADRIFNPSRETARLIGKVAKIGPHTRSARPGDLRPAGPPRPARDLRPSQSRRAIYPLRATSRARVRTVLDAEHASPTRPSSASSSVNAAADEPPRRRAAALNRPAPDIRAIEEYQAFWEILRSTQTLPPTPTDRSNTMSNVDH